MGNQVLIISLRRRRHRRHRLGARRASSRRCWSASSTRSARCFFPQAAGILVYVLMAAILLWRPEGLFRARMTMQRRARRTRYRWPAACRAARRCFRSSAASSTSTSRSRSMILAIFALSLELLVGRTGLVSFGHAAFFGIAAYATALLSPQAGAAVARWLLPAVLAIAALAALAVGALSLRTRGIYFIMVTLAFAQMAYYVFHDTKFGGGSDGIYLYVKPVARDRRRDADRSRPAADVLLRRRSPRWSRRLRAARAARSRRASVTRSPASRANEQRMRAAGFSTYPYKLAAFALAGALAGVAGIPVRGQGRLRQSGDPRVAPVGHRAADADPRRHRHAARCGARRVRVRAAEGALPVRGAVRRFRAGIGSCRSASRSSRASR